MTSSTTRTATSDRVGRVIAVGVGAVMLVAGFWALLSPRSFFDTLATFEPYNAHFLHDVGAFQIGLGAVLLLAVRYRDALFVALAGVAIGNTAHVVSHIMDTDLGGTPARDIPLLTLASVALIAGAIATSGRARAPR